MKTNNLTACGECDALQREVRLPPRGVAHCVRCGAELYRHHPAGLDITLAFVLAAAVAFMVAINYPLIGLDARGIRTTATLYETAMYLVEWDMSSVALLVLATTILMPALQLIGMLYMLVPLRMGFVPDHLHWAFRLADWAQPWAMLDVFLLGALVSLVRLTQVAKIDPGMGLFAIGAFVLLNAAALSSFEPRELWRRVEELGEPLPALLEDGARR
ncbi:MAG TPA: paraquat-inducible protein A [Usitatibacter sp.]|nr:paraquat-inducible protein A [Usitatibacter sp.]